MMLSSTSPSPTQISSEQRGTKRAREQEDESPEEEEETSYVLLQLPDSTEASFLSSISQYSIMGLEFGQPVISLKNTREERIFRGKLQDVAGSLIFFKNGEEGVEYYSHTSKKISLERVVLKEKDKKLTGTATSS
eukprot:TRINITY_DN7247_c0_g1_i1.p1 TRINITY_DN7247_c0_g1~~TRINITY_DN7247_c0_g1_i1.p1  ORF type:complete len:135 (+),score=30.89 TRINITY_DN7247_c0_g1_i1:50-454(+)